MTLFNNKVDTSQPYYRVDVIGDEGLSILNKHWSRGSQIFIQDGSETYKNTKDKYGNSWLDSKANNYKVTYLDPSKDEKLKDNFSLDYSDEDSKTETPKRGRPKNKE